MIVTSRALSDRVARHVKGLQVDLSRGRTMHIPAIAFGLWLLAGVAIDLTFWLLDRPTVTSWIWHLSDNCPWCLVEVAVTGLLLLAWSHLVLRVPG